MGLSHVRSVRSVENKTERGTKEKMRTKEKIIHKKSHIKKNEDNRENHTNLTEKSHFCEKRLFVFITTQKSVFQSNRTCDLKNSEHVLNPA